MDDNPMPNDTPAIHLEPRVAKLEAGLEILTKNVGDLTVAMRDFSSGTEAKLERITVAITEAKAPKKTDWSLFVSIAFLILALGSAVFWPLTQQTQNNKEAIDKYHASMVEHQKLDNHPVGTALMLRIEEQLKTHIDNNVKDFSDHVQNDIQEAASLRKYFQETIDNKQELSNLRNLIVESEMKGLKEKMELYTDKLYARILVLEQHNSMEVEKDRAELMLWRQKAMGLSTPSAVVPLVSRDSLEPPKK